MQTWFLKWIIAGLLVTGALAVTFLVAHAWRTDGNTANFSSIAGLGVSVIGFVVTILTLIDTQRVNRQTQEKAAADMAESQRKVEESAWQAQEATRQAQQQIRQMLEKVRHRTLEADCAVLHTWLQTLLRAAMRNEWPHALHLAEECPPVAYRLASADGLEAGEGDGIRAGADDVRLVGEFIRKNRMGNQTGSLQPAHTKAIRDLLGVLERLSGRLFHEPTKGV